MKTLNGILILMLAIKLSGCASGLKTQETKNHCTEKCNESQPDYQQAVAESFASGLGSGLGWGIGTALTRNW